MKASIDGSVRARFCSKLAAPLCALLLALGCAPVQPRFGGDIQRDVRDSTPDWRKPEALAPAPPGSPNVVIVLADDLGFSDIAPFGSEIETPNLTRLAERGVRLTNYTTHPVCSPSRAALLTGANAHSVGMGWVANTDSGFPGYRGELDANAATLAELLRARGYATAAVGKWHLTQHMTPAGPFDGWPLQRGFDRYYGILHGEASQWAPHRLYQDDALIDVDTYPDDFFLMDAFGSWAERWLLEHAASAPEQPFLLYFSATAVHSPIHSKAQDRAKYARRYDEGWDRVRAQRFQRQKAAGIVPPNTELPPSHPAVRAWSELSQEERELYAAHMANYAAMVDNLDQQVGRLAATLEALGQLDNTIFVFTSDNGATAHGGADGRFNWSRVVSGLPHISFEYEHERRALLGGPRSYPLYPSGWGQASNTPFRYFKTYAHGGGRRVPMIVSWPAGLSVRGELRDQFAHVTDVVPTLLEWIGVEHPERLRGRRLIEMEGVSFAGAIEDANSPSLHREQYYEQAGHRAFYRDGWIAVAAHVPNQPFADSEFELFDLENDWSEMRPQDDLHPRKERELIDAFEAAAARYQVYPLDDRSFARMSAASRPSGAPVEIRAGTPTVHMDVVAPALVARSHEIEVAFAYRPGDQGVLFAHGGQVAGSVLYVRGGRLVYEFNGYGAFAESDPTPISAGEHRASLQVVIRAGEGRELVARTTLLVDGEKRWTRDFAPALVGYPIEGFDVGADRRSPVSWKIFERYRAFAYTGELERVRITPAAPGER